MSKYTITYTVEHTSDPMDYVITIEADTPNLAIEYLLRWKVRPVTPLTISRFSEGGDAGQGMVCWNVTKDTPRPVKDTYTVEKGYLRG